jgi:HAD superfamily hydrolase (TIGR01509 family)
MKEIKAVIFDCDGVIVDSEIVFLKSLQSYLKSKGIEVSIGEIQDLVGKTVNKMVGDLAGRYEKLRDTEYCQIGNDIRFWFDREWNEAAIDPMPGLTHFIETLASRGIRMAVASSSRLSYLNDLLIRFNIINYFDLVQSGTEINNSKPMPDIYNLVVKKLELDKSDVIVIEDSVNGIESSKRAGLYTVGFKGSVVIQDTSNADLEVSSFSELEDKLGWI